MLKTKKEATMFHALIPLVVLAVSLIASMTVFGVHPQIPILFATIIAASVGIFALGYTWSEVQEGIVSIVTQAMPAILIIMVVGTLIGTWILGGIVPTMIYYGLRVISPGIFLVASFILGCIASLATGSSFAAAGTVGVALMGVGAGLGIPAGLVAGSVVSGVFFGDKMSPLSDTTNLAPAVAGSNLFEHIRHMLYTTAPAWIISLVLYAILGARYAGEKLDVDQINLILAAISENFTISPLLLMPPIIVLVIIICRIPALPGLLVGTILGALCAAIFQGANLGDIIVASHYGYSLESGVKIVDSLLSRGGLHGKMWSVSLILVALSFGGVIEKTGMIRVIVKRLLSFAKNTGQLILSTVFSSIAVNFLVGEQYLSVVIPGRMFKDTYAERGIHPKVLSRALEGGGTLVNPLVPWGVAGAFMFTTLGVSPLAFAPFAFFCILTPIVNIIYGYLGITITPLDEKNTCATAHSS